MKNTLILALLLFSISCATKKQLLFYAFTESFVDWYKLELFEDKSFNLHIPSADYSGFFRIDGDTIFLNYKEANIGDVPQTYLINNEKLKIDELILLEGKFKQRLTNNRWIQIVKNDLPNNTKKPQ